MNNRIISITSCLLLLLLAVLNLDVVANISIQTSDALVTRKPLNAVMLTTKDYTRAFEKSIMSALKYLVDVDKFYVVAPGAAAIEAKLSKLVGPRVVFVDESIFPFDWRNVSETMITTVEQRGVYPMAGGKTPFEHTVYSRTGWFLQQLLKFYAGRVLKLGDFVLLDSDVVFFRNISFVNATSPGGVTRYNYASSSQYHPAYMATLTRISGVGLFETGKDVHRSGICHHMVIVERVLDHLIAQTEARYRIPFWQVLLNESALELTCRAPRTGICGAGSTLSEYELYFNYALVKFPETVALRPLLWTNGPAPGLLFWPPVEHELHSDGPKNNWMGHRQVDGESL